MHFRLIRTKEYRPLDKEVIRQLLLEADRNDQTYHKGSLGWPDPGDVYIVQHEAKAFCNDVQDDYKWHGSSGYSSGKENGKLWRYYYT